LSVTARPGRGGRPSATVFEEVLHFRFAAGKTVCLVASLSDVKQSISVVEQSRNVPPLVVPPPDGIAGITKITVT
jgi:hypothetical protein